MQGCTLTPKSPALPASSDRVPLNGCNMDNHIRTSVAVCLRVVISFTEEGGIYQVGNGGTKVGVSCRDRLAAFMAMGYRRVGEREERERGWRERERERER